MSSDSADPGATRERLARLLLDGDNLRGQAAGPQPQTARNLRSAYLAWHDELLGVLNADFPNEPIAERYETTRWRLLLGGQVAEDQLTRTVLGDLDAKLQLLQQLRDTVGVPPRALSDPATVGVAVYDANCLFSKHIRHLLVGFAVYGIVRARWSLQLLKETAGNLARTLRGDALEDLGRWLKEETDLVRDGLVEGYERWLDQINLPDQGDAHVVATAIEAGATLIVTKNLRHFPAKELEPLGITAEDPDDFALRCIDANPVLAVRVVADHPDPELFLTALERELPKAVRALRELGA